MLYYIISGLFFSPIHTIVHFPKNVMYQCKRSFVLQKTRLHASDYALDFEEILSSHLPNESFIEPRYITEPGIDERYPLNPPKNYTEIEYLARIFEYARLLYRLETPLISIDDRAELAKDFFEMDKPRKVNIIAGGLMDFWEDSV
jgi:hypothetical protein